MNRVYQQRKEKQLARKREAWNTPQFSNKQYYEQLNQMKK